MYKEHKVQLLLVTLLTMLLVYIFDFRILDLSLELMLFSLSLLIIYSLFLTNLTQDKELCKKLKHTEDKEIKAKSHLWIILNYFRIGVRMCILSIVLSLLFKLLHQMQFAYLIQYFNVYLLCANILIFRCLIIFIINRQVYR